MFFTTVTLTSSADSVYPGDTVVFTCVTDTAPLIWSSNGATETYFTPNQVNEAARTLGIFSLQLVATNGGFKSTATVHNVSTDYNGVNITCSNCVNDVSCSKTRSISVGEKSYIIICMKQLVSHKCTTACCCTMSNHH